MTQELIIAGFHRSGTSFTTQALHASGLFVGNELLAAHSSNPYGHFEDRRVVKFHDEVLAANGRNWQVDRPFVPVISSRQWSEMERFVSDRRKEHQFWGFKDPRVCLFLGAWHHVMPGAKFLMVYRHYGSSVQSLHRRHGEELTYGRGDRRVHRRFFTQADLALKMWHHHNLALKRFAEANRDKVMVVEFGRLAKGFNLLDALNKKWGLPVSGDEASAFYDRKVTRNATHIDVSDSAIRDKADALYESLGDLHEVAA